MEVRAGLIIIKSSFPINPLERYFWRMLGLLLNRSVQFNMCECNGYIIEIKDIVIYSPKIADYHSGLLPFVSDVCFKNQVFKVYAKDKVNIRQIKNELFFSVDIWTSLISLLQMEEESADLRRDRCGLVLGFNSHRAGQDKSYLLVDLLHEVARLVSFAIGEDVLLSDKKYPYVVAITFDVDGFFEGQPEKVMNFLMKWNIRKPTFMLMAANVESATMYDPIYDLDDQSLRVLYDSDIEIGLHSSYIAHDDLELLIEQKIRLEKSAGRSIIGHRSHYYRFAFPRSWGQQIMAGFKYDASLGYPDLPGMRNGTSIPVSFPDPNGSFNLFWTISTTCLDQHFFDRNSILNWHENGNKNIDEILTTLRNKRGLITLDWHVHGIDNPQFPNHYAPLEYILDQAQRDGALITGIGSLVNEITTRWDLLYADLKWSFRERFNITIDIDQNEISNYINTFSKVNLGDNSIDNSMMSLVSILPKDAESILDIGCGPGLMTRRIPTFHKILCMDIDERIIAGINKTKSLGDIKNIPLEDKSVDMVMACDVLEHLDDSELVDAVKELQRVSRKYIYVQTPLLEVIDAGMVRCDKCGYTWHINGHKQSFAIKDIINLFSENWKVKIINFTGSVSDTSVPYEYFEMRKILGCGFSIAGETTCNKCGNVFSNHLDFSCDEIVKFIVSKFKSDSFLSPKYSEVGILFENMGVPYEDRGIVQITGSGNYRKIESTQIYTDRIDFSQYFDEIDYYSYFNPVPKIIPCQVALIKGDKGINAIKSDFACNPSIAISFPHYLDKGDIIEIEGRTDVPITLTVIGSTIALNEFEVAKFNLNQDFTLEMRIPNELVGSMCFIRLVWEGASRLNVKKVKLKQMTGKSKIFNIYNPGKDTEFSHLEVVKNGILYRWALSYGEMVKFTSDIESWIDNINDLKRNSFDKSIVMDGFNLLRKHISQQEEFIYFNKVETDNYRQCPQGKDIAKLSINNVVKENQLINTDNVENDNEICRNKNDIYAKHEAIQCVDMLEDKIIRLEEKLSSLSICLSILEEEAVQKRQYIQMLEDMLKAKEKHIEDLDIKLCNSFKCIGILEENYNIKPRYSLRNSFFFKLTKKIVKKIVRIVKKMPLLVRIIDFFGLRKMYAWLKNWGLSS